MRKLHFYCYHLFYETNKHFKRLHLTQPSQHDNIKKKPTLYENPLHRLKNV